MSEREAEHEVYYRIRPSGTAELAIPLPASLNSERILEIMSRTDPDHLIERLSAYVARECKDKKC